MILYIKNPKESPPKTIRTNVHSVKLQDTKLTLRSQLYLCTPITSYQKEIKETIPFIIASKRINCVGINLTKDVKDLYSENHKALFKEIEEMSEWKHIPCSWTAITDIIKMFILPKAFHSDNTVVKCLKTSKPLGKKNISYKAGFRENASAAFKLTVRVLMSVCGKCWWFLR